MYQYIDPGTGSMLFTILISIIGASIYSIRVLIVKLRNGLLGKKAKAEDEKIPFVIYSDGKQYWNIFEPICREMNELGREIVYLTGSEDDPVFECEYPNVRAKFIGKGNSSFAQLNYLKANIVLSTTPGLDVYQWKRSKDVDCYAHILHSAGEIVLYRMFGIDYYDALLVAGDFQIEGVRELERIRKLPEKEIVKVGLPFMDEMVKRLEKDGPVAPHERTVLLAPSWGNSGMFKVFGGQIIELLLKTGYHVIVRPHPQTFRSETEMIEKIMADYPESEQLEWNRDTDNYEVLRRADIMISDFSGVMYDFALVYDKPVIYTVPKLDLSVYDAWWLGDKPLWKISSLARIGCELTRDNLENIKDVIDTCLDDNKYDEGRDSVRQESWACYGEGAKKTAEYLVNKYEELTREEK